MNILNYKWPAFAAASLHGALLLLTPGTPTIISPPQIREVPLPLPPTPEPVTINEEDKTADTSSQKAASGPAVAELPEVPPPLIDNGPTMKIPVAERTPMGPISHTLVDINGKLPGIGPGGGDGPGNVIVTLADLDRIPRATVQPSPQYPDSMKKDGMTGSVTVEFCVDSSGKVYRAEATKYTHRSFVDPAVRAVLKWRFEPGKRNGHAVPFRMAVPVEFGLAAN